MSDSREQIVSRFLSALLLVPMFLLIPAAFEIVSFAWQCVGFPYQLDPEEGALLFQSIMLRHGELFYRPLTDYPYVAGTYAPLYQTLNAILFLFIEPGFAPGRILNLIAVVSVLLFSGAILWRQTRCPFISMCCPLFFIVSYSMVYWIGFFRADLLAIALNTAGLAVLFAVKTRETHHAWLAGALFLLAGYTKQSQLIAPLSALIYLCRGDRKLAWRMALVWLGGGAIVFILFNIITRGQFYIHTVRFNANEFDWGQMRGYLTHLRNFNGWLAAGGALSAAYLTYAAIRDRLLQSNEHKENAEEKVSGDPLFFALYAALNLLYIAGMAKKGSSFNYVLEPMLSLGMLTGVGVGRMLDEALRHPARTIRRKLWVGVGYASFAALFVALSLHAWGLCSGGFPHPRNRFRKVMYWRERINLSSGDPLRIGNHALEAVRQTQGEVYSELPIFTILADRPAHFQPFILSRLAREDKWDQSGFVRDLRERKFALLILTEPVEKMNRETGTNLYTAEMAQAMQESYRRLRAERGAGRLFSLYYYVPKS